MAELSAALQQRSAGMNGVEAGMDMEETSLTLLLQQSYKFLQMADETHKIQTTLASIRYCCIALTILCYGIVAAYIIYYVRIRRQRSTTDESHGLPPPVFHHENVEYGNGTAQDEPDTEAATLPMNNHSHRQMSTERHQTPSMASRNRRSMMMRKPSGYLPNTSLDRSLEVLPEAWNPQQPSRPSLSRYNSNIQQTRSFDENSGDELLEHNEEEDESSDASEGRRAHLLAAHPDINIIAPSLKRTSQPAAYKRPPTMVDSSCQTTTTDNSNTADNTGGAKFLGLALNRVRSLRGNKTTPKRKRSASMAVLRIDGLPMTEMRSVKLKQTVAEQQKELDKVLLAKSREASPAVPLPRRTSGLPTMQELSIDEGLVDKNPVENSCPARGMRVRSSCTPIREHVPSQHNLGLSTPYDSHVHHHQEARSDTFIPRQRSITPLEQSGRRRHTQIGVTSPLIMNELASRRAGGCRMANFEQDADSLSRRKRLGLAATQSEDQRNASVEFEETKDRLTHLLNQPSHAASIA